MMSWPVYSGERLRPHGPLVLSRFGMVDLCYANRAVLS